MVQIYDGILLSHENEKNPAIWGDVNWPRDCHTEWNKSEKNKYWIILLTCGI